MSSRTRKTKARTAPTVRAFKKNISRNNSSPSDSRTGENSVHPVLGDINGFACADCVQKGTPLGGRVTPAGFVGVNGGAVCTSCAERTARVLVQRIAYALGLDVQTVGVAIAAAPPVQEQDGYTYLDEALGLRPGQFDAALEFAVGALPHD